MIDKIRPRKLNASSDSRQRKPDEMQDALNLVSSNDFRSEGDTTAGNDATGNAGVLKPTRGNIPLEVHTSGVDEIVGGSEGGKSRILGSVTDHENDVVYFFVYHQAAAFQGVYAYDPTGYLPEGTASTSYRKIYTSTQFKFPSNGFIKADIVRLSRPFDYEDKQYESQPVLYFTDNVNEPRKLHPLRALTESLLDYTAIDVKDFITACPKTPIHPIEAVFENDINDPTSAFEGLPGFQFAYQHLYKGGEESALSTFSDIAVPPAYYTQGSSTDAYLSSNNKCKLRIRQAIVYDAVNQNTLRSKEVKEIRILARVGNRGAWKVVEEVEAPQNDLIYDFYNRRIFGGFSQTDAIKPFDNLPQKAQAQAVVSDRLTYGNYVEGYDNVKVEAKATIVYHERPDDFSTLDIKVTPTIKPSGEASASGQQNKRAGYYIDTSNIPDAIGAGSYINFELFVRPNRNFHIYNSHQSFHGSRHLSLLDGDDQVSGTTTVRAPEVWGEGANLASTCSSYSDIQHMDNMWGRNTGIGAVNDNGEPELRWNTPGTTQADLTVNNPRCVFGTSAANPFILRGHNLHFSARLKVLGDIESGDGLTAAQTTIKNALVAALSGDVEYPYEANGLALLSSKSNPTYFINEALAGGNIETSTEEAISTPYRIPVASGGDTGGDDRKYLICSVGNYDVINESASLDDVRHQSPCGYFIANKAKVEFALNDIGSGFLELDLRNLSGLELLTAIPFIDAEAWKDDAYEARANGCGIVESGDDNKNYGVRDATYWSLDSLIIDSWYVYSKEYVLLGEFNPKIFTPIPTDFPRYMNGSSEANLGPGSPNPAQANGGSEPGIGKNAAIVRLDAYDSIDEGFLNSSMYQVRSKGGAGGANNFGESGCGNEFEQWYLQSYLKLVSRAAFNANGQDIITRDKLGRLRVVGYLDGVIETDFYAGGKEALEAGNGVSIVDGAIGPGGYFHGGENTRSGLGAAESAYTIGSVSGEMVFSGRLAPRGYFIPTKAKQGERLQLSPMLFNNLWKAYGQGPMLPYLGGLYYQSVYGSNNKGHIHNFQPTDEPATLLINQFFDDTLTSAWEHEARYLGYSEANSSFYNNAVDADKDLFVSAKLDDSEITASELEARIIDASEERAGGRSFKTRATHSFGLVYYDERGRSGNVNPIKFTTVNDDVSNSEGVYVKGYSNDERADKGRVSVEITLENDPPAWAHNYQVVYGGNTTKGNFIQYTTGGACIANLNLNTVGEDEGEDPPSTNIYVSLNYLQNNKDVSYAEAFGAVSPLGRKELYTYKEGDKLRVLSYYTSTDNRVWPHDYEFDILGVETVTNNPEENIFRKAFEKDDDNNVVADFRTGQFLVLRNNPRAEGFNYSNVKEAENEAETTSHNWNDVCVVEIYSPSKSLEEEERLFYETGKVYDVGRNNEGVPYHKTNFIKMTKGDVWFRRGALAIPEFGDLEQDSEGNNLESFGMFKNLIQRGNDEGDNSPRFRDYYVEAMTFSDAFAGNNVLSVGKPKAIRPDEQQVRKRSSIIYSDKHNFSKKNIKFTSFNGTASNFKDLPNEYGRINYLQNNYDSLLCIQENKSSSLPVERNIISDAAGSKSLITTDQVIGVQAFFAGEYGCDNNPESVVKTDAATYFASKAKSEVYRLTAQGISVISNLGLKSYFFRIFEEAKETQAANGGKIYMPGGYDPLKDEFLITIGNLPSLVTTGETVYVAPGLGEVVEEAISGLELAGDGNDDLPDIEIPDDNAAVLVTPLEGFYVNPNNTANNFQVGGNATHQEYLTLTNLSSTTTAVVNGVAVTDLGAGFNASPYITVTPGDAVISPSSSSLLTLNIVAPETIDESFAIVNSDTGATFYEASALVTISFTNATDVTFPVSVVIEGGEDSLATGSDFVVSFAVTQPIGTSTLSPSDLSIDGLSSDFNAAQYTITVKNQGNVDGSFSINGFSQQFYEDILIGGGIQYGDGQVYTWENSGGGTQSLHYIDVAAGTEVDLIFNIGYNPDVFVSGDSINYGYTLDFSTGSTDVMEGSDYNYQGNITINIAGDFVLVGDFSGNGYVDIPDLLIFLGQYGSTGDDLISDLNDDGTVTAQDLLIFLENFGRTAPDIDGLN